MAVAAYASVVSLMHTVDNALHPCRRHLLANATQIQTLQENLALLQDVLEKLPLKINKAIDDLARQIPIITNEADDIIDRYIVDRMVGGYEDQTDMDLFYCFCRNIDGVIQYIVSINQKLIMEMMLGDHKMGISDHNPPKVPVPESSSSSETAFNDKSSTVVGFEKPLLEIMEKLDGQHGPNLQVIPIVGMAGIGKTTLARIIFERKYIVDKFDIRIWLTISQDYDVHQLLKGLLNDGILGKNKTKVTTENVDDLGLQLHQTLCGRKYLVVMDDVWTTQAWDGLRSFFPDNGNGSRIVVTTRLSDVASLLSSKNSFSMDYLDEVSSWNLFSERAFARGGQSLTLVEIGTRIAKSCRGLPIALVVIGGLLANSDMTRAYWELVAKNVSSFANSDNDEHCLRILSLSYDHLPIHLKPCFLYMSVFPEDKKIKVSELITMWIAEGFIKPLRDKTLEEVALKYLKDLVGRNIIGIRQLSRGNIKTCSIHDLLRDLCLREYRMEYLLSVPRTQLLTNPDSNKYCFVCGLHRNYVRMTLSKVNLFFLSSTSNIVCPLACNACRVKYPQLIRFRFVTLIKTIGGKSIDIPQTTKSRYVHIEYVHRWKNKKYAYKYVEFVAPSSMTLLWNLQSLLIFTEIKSPVPLYEIWQMPQLRHLYLGENKFDGAVLLDKPETSRDDFTVLVNMQTLGIVSDLRCTEEVVRRIPNLRKLCLVYKVEGSKVADVSCYCLNNLAKLRKLESLSLSCYGVPFENIKFPCSLKKLSLGHCRFSWEDINTVGLLPTLEVLKLWDDSVVGDEWNPIEGRFLRLKSLNIKWNFKLVRWNADERHFPVLETLILQWVHMLEKIPSSFGDINTMQLITLDFCSESVINSAKEIIDEQHRNENETLQLSVWNDYNRTYDQYGGAS